MANCNCNNGKTFVISLTTIPGGTAADANYLLQLDHFTCGNKKLCISESYPISADLKATAMGVPVDVGNGTFCQEVLISGNVNYMPYKYGCQCGTCPVSEAIFCNICIPCSSNVTPTLAVGNSVAAPTNVQPCCSVTNCMAITTTLNVTTGA